jgi:hypothetical protein
MLVVRRAALAEALHDLRRRRLIKAGRGEIIVLDRAGLEAWPALAPDMAPWPAGALP